MIAAATPERAAGRTHTGANEQEQLILDLLVEGARDGEELQARSQLEVTAFNQTLTMLEITGKIRSLGAGQWTLN